MKLKFKEKYKSIKKFNSIEIPNFTVLTGVNGSGKSQLLKAIKDKKVIIEEIKNSNNIVHFDYQNFRLNNENSCNALGIEQEKISAWNFFEKNIQPYISRLKENHKEKYQKIVNLAIKNDKDIWNLSAKDFNNPEMYYFFKEQYKKVIESKFKQENRLNPHMFSLYNGVFLFVKSISCDIDEITKENFLDVYNFINLKDNFFPTQIGKIILDYHNKFYKNKFSKFLNKEEGQKNKILSEADFEKKYGPNPLNVINKILKEFDILDYELKSPAIDYNPSFQAKLTYTKDKNLEINFEDLSSGEKILMALVISIYKENHDNFFPDVLLLDEIDMSLHPSMIQKLLNVMEDVFLKRQMKIILVSHSATTIALAPEKSIYIMNKSGENRIEKTTRKEALEILTEGYMTLEEGIKLFNEIRERKELLIFTEGNNTEYIKKAAKFFGGKNENKIGFIDEIKAKSGKNQLKTLFEFFSLIKHGKKLLFIWDCDVGEDIKKLIAKNNVFPYVLIKNESNKRVPKGIENLFEEKKFENKFFDKNPWEDSGLDRNPNKRKFEKHMIEKGTKKDFENFKPLFQKINEILNK